MTTFLIAVFLVIVASVLIGAAAWDVGFKEGTRREREKWERAWMHATKRPWPEGEPHP